MTNIYGAPITYSSAKFGRAVGIIKKDDKPDILGITDSKTIVIFRNKGDGVFKERESFVGNHAYNKVTDIKVADVNGDGRPDIVTSSLGDQYVVFPVASYSPGAVSVLINDGQDAFASAVDFSVDETPYSVAAADLNGDGNIDLVTANYQPNTISVLISEGNAKFKSQVKYSLPHGGENVIVADVNGDKKPDIVAASNNAIGEGAISVFIGKGNGQFDSPTNYEIGGSVQVVASDLNGDGHLDLAILCKPQFLTFQGVSVMLNKGNGQFESSVDYAVEAYGSLGVGDVNGDGAQDVVLRDSDETNGKNCLAVLLNNGKGGLGSPIESYCGDTESTVTLADVNDDGKPDAITVSAVFLNVLPLCPVGDIRIVGEISCKTCSFNQYSKNPYTCATCTVGSFLDKNPGSSCTPCPPGYYNADLGLGSNYTDLAACNPAPIGTFTNASGSLAPQPCPLGTTTLAPAGTSCDAVTSSAPVNVLDVTDGGARAGSVASDVFNVITGSDVKLFTFTGQDVVKPSVHGGQTIAVTDFDTAADKLDLTNFAGLRKFSDLTITQGSAVIHLPNNQRVVLENLHPDNMTASNFVFATQPTASGSSESGLLGLTLGLTLGITGGLTVALCLGLVGMCAFGACSSHKELANDPFGMMS